MSEIARIIEEVIRLDLAGELRAGGFRRTAGRTFHREAADHVCVVNVQSSTSSGGTRGKFTLNLAIHFPEVERLAGELPAAKPREYECTVRKRIGTLMPGKTDQWWEFDGRTNRLQLAASVANAWREYGRPWMDRHAELRACLKDLEAHKAAAACLVLGDRDSAHRYLLQAMNEARSSANLLFAQRQTRFLAQWAKTHGLDAPTF